VKPDDGYSKELSGIPRPRFIRDNITGITDSIEVLFKELSKIFKGYNPRQAQIELANIIRQSVIKNEILLAEAGVGTGKTFAYLISALLEHTISHPRTAPIVISTKTKTLQHQLISEDIPIMKKFFESLLPTYPFPEVILSKGRSNYLCLNQLEKLKDKGIVNFNMLRSIQNWYKLSEYGDLEESNVLKIPENIASNITA